MALEIFGSLGLFLYGMRVMSDGIQKTAGNKLRGILNLMTTNRFTGVLTGFLITCLIQSSSATTVMVVSFVNAGLFSLQQSIGVIMGANIGTTLTGWIVAVLGFKISIGAAALPAIGFGIVLLLIKRLDREEWGEILIGFGLLFLGLSLLKDSVPDIRSNPEVLQFLSKYTDLGFLSFLIFVAAGTALTVVVQSSSAAMAITIAMAYSGWIDFPTAAAIVLGENIGTTVTAYLASLNGNVNARRAARAHLIFNLFGVFWIAFLFRPFLSLVDWIIPGAADAEGIPTHLALFHTLFNVTNTLVCVGFVKQFAQVTTRLVRARKSEKPAAHLKYIHAGIQDTAELNVLNARAELSHMAEKVEAMYTLFLNVFRNPKENKKKEIKSCDELETVVNTMQQDISAFLIECSRENLTEKAARNINAMIRITNEMESIGDSCQNLMKITRQRYDEKLGLKRKSVQKLEPFLAVVSDFLKFNKEHLDNNITAEDLERAYEMEKKINSMRNKLKKSSLKRLKTGGSVEGEMLYVDIVRHIEHIGDFSLNITQALKIMS